MGISTVTVRAFSGGAGCGKTYQLMQTLREHLVANPLNEGQKVLALTFMHGSRRRLEERLAQLPGLKNRTNCSTIDSFAWRLIRRWSSLVVRLGFGPIEVDDYERVCDAAGALLQIKEVCCWVAATYPVLLVDEAQDLTPNRLLLVSGLAARLEVLVAADEFQCLDENLRPNPACSWLKEVCGADELLQPMRTSIVDLLDAARAIRNGEAPKHGKLFQVCPTHNQGLAGTYLSNALAWYGYGKSVAVIAPTVRGFATQTLDWVARNTTKQGNGPYSVRLEESETKAAEKLLSSLALKDQNNAEEVIELLAESGDILAKKEINEWMSTQRRTRGTQTFTKAEIERVIKQSFARKRLLQKANEGGWKAMSVHGAKNREFDIVIVLWPAAVRGSDEQKRRLLYNAITRAKERCLILVQAKVSLAQAPFA